MIHRRPEAADHHDVFHDGSRPVGQGLRYSPILVDSLSDLLVKGNILVKIDRESDNGQALQPARDIGNLTVNEVVAALEDVGNNDGLLSHLPEAEPLSESLTALRSELERSASNRLLKDI